MIAEARLDVRLQREDGGFRPVIGSSRSPVARALVLGKPPATAAALLPRLFALCALAQGSAAAAACEMAAGAAPDPARDAARAFLVAAEAAREHLLRLVIGAADTLGETPTVADLAALRGLTEALRQAARADTAAAWHMHSAAVSRQLAILIDDHLCGADIGDADGFSAWAGTGVSPLARLCRAILERDQATLGAAPETEGLPDLDPAAIAGRLLGAGGAAFAAAPTWDGRTRETTAFARRRDEPLVATLVAAHGDGLLTRLAARQLEVGRLADSLPALAEEGEPVMGALTPAAGPRDDGDGVAMVETARGRLIHAVRVKNGSVAEYRIVAPTEWNFHPDGPVARRLARLDPADPAAIDRAARLLVDVFDPCVPYSLTVQ